jgi:benzil reductase ((S)-benzoin forming)
VVILSNIFITGTTSGLGKALAKTYSKTGYEIYGLSRTKSNEYNHVTCDLERVYDISYKLSTLLKDVKEIDVVYLNAGVLGTIEYLNKIKLHDLETSFTINTWANKVIIDYMIMNNIEVKQVVAISSGASQKTYTGWGEYSISKAALNMMIQVYAEEHPDIHFLSVSPGPVDTPMQDYIKKIMTYLKQVGLQIIYIR